MSRNLLLYLLPVGLLAVGVYLGFSANSPDDGESRSPPLKVQSQSESVDPEASRSYPAPPQESLEDGDERVAFSPAPELKGKDAQKRDGPVPEEDDVHQLIDEALRSSESEDRAFALSELGLLEPTSQILLACLEALNDPDEEVRGEAVLALEMLEQHSAIPVLQRVTEEDPSEEVREAASEALKYLMNP
ncbi:HEAT repeat domain-containing protein [Acidobacteria bacterium AH-259-L09]|nr:HEAT repeat domain-containing protein [Acidobacteria bacterium AH-259-L09]